MYPPVSARQHFNELKRSLCFRVKSQLALVCNECLLWFYDYIVSIILHLQIRLVIPTLGGIWPRAKSSKLAFCQFKHEVIRKYPILRFTACFKALVST